jgi:predicted nucleic acid-binding protein
LADSILYIDTNIIIDILFAKRSQAISENKRMVNRIKSRYKIIIPQIVIGEIIVKIIEKTSSPNSKTEQSQKLSCSFALAQDITNLNDNSPPVDRDILSTALTLVNDEDGRNIDYCDAVITSFALTSNKNCRLLTSGSKIHQSRNVSEIITERQGQGAIVEIIDGENI